MARVHVLALLCLVVAASSLSLGAQATTGADASVGVYELKLGNFSVKVTNWGARLMSVVLPDSKGNLADVVLGRDTLAEYYNDTSYFGPITGRVAQRISKGRFVVDGKVYHLQLNDGNNTIHGGGTAFSKSVWTVKEYVAGGSGSVSRAAAPLQSRSGSVSRILPPPPLRMNNNR